MTPTNIVNPLPPVPPVRRFRRGDAWGRSSYVIPSLAVAGTSYTGEWSDSPAPRRAIEPELGALRKFLATHNIKTRLSNGGPAGNIFCAKIWVQARRADFARAFPLAEQWLAEHDGETHYIHDARG